MDAGQREALRDVAGNVGAHEVQRDAGPPGSLQAGHPMADLLETRLEATGDALDIVARLAAGREERFVGHHQRRGEIAGERVAADGRGVDRDGTLGDAAIDLVARRQQAELLGDRKKRRFGRQRVRGDDLGPGRIEPPRDAARQRRRGQVEPEHVEQVGLQPVLEGVGGAIDIGADPVRPPPRGRESGWPAAGSGPDTASVET